MVCRDGKCAEIFAFQDAGIVTLDEFAFEFEDIVGVVSSVLQVVGLLLASGVVHPVSPAVELRVVSV